MATLPELQDLLKEAHSRGDREGAMKLMDKIESVKSDIAAYQPTREDAVPLQTKVRQAQLQAAPDYTKGLIFMGRGFSNLTEGLEQIGTNLGELAGEKFGVGLSKEQAEAFREMQQRRMREANSGYRPLAEEYPGSAVFGEIFGETAPFMNLPVPQVGGALAARPLLGMPLRAAPEASVAALEGQVPYAPPESDRATDAQGDALVAALTRGIVERFTRRANANRGLMESEDLTELHELGREMNVPVREGMPDAQARAASSVAEARTTAEMPGALATEVVQDLQGQMAGRQGGFDQAYTALFNSLEGQRVPMSGLKRQIQGMMESEMKRGSHARNELTQEYRKWLDTPEDGLTPGMLQEFRSGLRETIRGLPGEKRQSAEALNALEETVTGTLTREMDRMLPGSGEMLRNMDTWYYEDLARLRRLPGVRGALAENPTPQNFVSWMISKPNDQKMQVFNMLSDEGKDAVRKSFWNAAWRKGNQGAEFKPLQYAKFLEDHLESAQQILEPVEAAAAGNVAKLFRHIAGEGKAADVSFWNFMRGFPFLWRSAAQNIKQSNFMYMMANASPDLKPGSPEMDRFYRSVLRGLVIQDREEVGSGVSGLRDQAADLELPPMIRPTL